MVLLSGFLTSNPAALSEPDFGKFRREGYRIAAISQNYVHMRNVSEAAYRAMHASGLHECGAYANK